MTDLSLIPTHDLVQELANRCPTLFLACEEANSQSLAVQQGLSGSPFMLVCNANRESLAKCMHMVGAGIRTVASRLSEEPHLMTGAMLSCLLTGACGDDDSYRELNDSTLI